MQCYKAAFILSLLFCPFLASAAGVAIAGTRVIYNEQSHEADITVKNTNPHDPVLIQSWVDDLADNNKSPFIVTPPLFRLDAGDSNDLRVLLTSAQLPNDRESLFTLNIKVIPANTAPAGKNILQFAIKNQLKLIYRPAGLPGSALDAAQHLRWRVSGNHLQAKNASPYYVTITTLSCAGQNQKTPLERSVIAPHSREEYSLPGEACAREVSWRILDDFGAVQTFSAPVSAH
ncbi:molecular chaperone [Klebsiella pneumoniae]|uniref:fimbrial biogenesis chaperone n=1 Tax=Klebsiella TaxID=570 RepID=UPI00078DEA68|nr:molecular chaperone [Klebsiella pneumoniae]AMV51931.1 fimbrial protein [Klebsiella pneumoniae subsp. pneumoniae]AMV57068.1 fimbrial protein [Klebsiella pneumoniae subsp. pneumoniae]AUJ40320.1 fimbrial protein [Klebsiella pneumoniae]AUJ45587.1 fimbrial protein [Klebsiella pneumoniae]EIV5316543.1 molecular chaperone [Klebsiella pneumoniae]